MSLNVTLTLQSESCTGCDAIDERFMLQVLRDDIEKIDELCLNCASSLTHQLQKLLREVPTI